MPTKKRIKRVFIAKKDIPFKKKIYLLFSILAALLLIGYFLYKESKENNNSLNSGKNKSYSINKIQTKTEIEKGENLLPIIKKAKLQFESLDNTDKLKVIIEEKEDEKKGIKYNYEWFKNGEPFGGNIDSITGFKKGDIIDVKITPFDDKQYGQPKLLSIEIARVTPKIVENKEISFDGNVLTYQVKAVDPDGGALKYSLIDPPKGMSINDQTGIILWQVKAEDYGKHDIKVRISSVNGAEIVYPLNIDLSKITE
ncbi:MAG: cadherin repeat domain-containing protein [Proteobacteria bacterium]|nr:cadherin repeat domain-containing protein [Pseudomonadota bacterium]